MSLRWSFVVFAALWTALWTAGFVPPVRAQQPDTPAGPGAPVAKDVGGIIFKFPADWPIEVRADGVVAPIAIEEYLVRKFDVANTRMKSLEERIQELEKRNQTLETVLQSLSKILQEIAPPTKEKPPEP
jgi:hypothetical protein